MIREKQKLILIISLIFNFVFISFYGFYIYKKGYSPADILFKIQGTIKERIPSDEEYLSSEYYRRHASIYDSCTSLYATNKNHVIVFYGDSITHNNAWHEYFPSELVINRGISGDTTYGLLKRLNTVIDLYPKKLFLMIGTNDLWRQVEVDQVVSNIETIVEKVSNKSPLTKIYIQSVTPVRDHPKSRVENIKRVNAKLEALAAKHGYIFIDLYSIFADKNDELIEEYTFDGLHLNGKGYKVWAEKVKPYVLGD